MIAPPKKEELEALYSHPKVKRFLCDDGAEDGMDIEKQLHIGVYRDKKLAGVLSFSQLSSVTIDVHMVIHPDFWGKSVELMREAGVFMFTKTPCLKIVTMTPAFNRLAGRVAKKLGMKKEGLLKDSFLKGWKLHDQIIYGITKREALWQL